jgi:hypothetical protein
VTYVSSEWALSPSFLDQAQPCLPEFEATLDDLYWLDYISTIDDTTINIIDDLTIDLSHSVSQIPIVVTQDNEILTTVNSYQPDISRELQTAIVTSNSTSQQCQRSSPSTLSSTSHLPFSVEHNGQFKCLDAGCGKHFPTQGRLNRHRRRQTQRRRCEHCSKDFADRKDLERHVLAKHISNTQAHIYLCPAESAGCKYKGSERFDVLRRHVRGQRHIEQYGEVSLNRDNWSLYN